MPKEWQSIKIKIKKMTKRILVACEESDEVRGRLEKLGFDFEHE